MILAAFAPEKERPLVGQPARSTPRLAACHTMALRNRSPRDRSDTERDASIPSPPRPAVLRFARRVAAAAAPLLLACACGATRGAESVDPELTPSRLGGLRCAMTYDGDWLGGMSSSERIAGDLELAARRGVEVVLDLRGPDGREALPLDVYADALGLALVAVDLGADGTTEGLPVTEDGVDRVRALLETPGRRRTLLLDDDGTLASMIYAIHLAADEGVDEDTALRAARATGLGDGGERFVRDQIARIRAAGSS